MNWAALQKAHRRITSISWAGSIPTRRIPRLKAVELCFWSARMNPRSGPRLPHRRNIPTAIPTRWTVGRRGLWGHWRKISVPMRTFPLAARLIIRSIHGHCAPVASMRRRSTFWCMTRRVCSSRFAAHCALPKKSHCQPHHPRLVPPAQTNPARPPAP